MKIRLEDQLPFATVKLGQGTEELVLERVLLDTGTATTVFSVDEIATLGIVPEPTDRICRLVAIGGIELVLAKRIQSLALGDQVSRTRFEGAPDTSPHLFSVIACLGR